MIIKSAFRETCFFALGVFCWSAYINIYLFMFQTTQTGSMAPLIAALVGAITAVVALKNGKQWYGENE